MHQSVAASREIKLQGGRVTEQRASAPLRYWPKYEIPEGTPQLVYEPNEASTLGGPITVSWTKDLLFVQDTSAAVAGEAGGASSGRSRRALRPATIRDSCACASCKDVSSGQKSFASTEIPLDIGISHVRATDDGLAISFSNDIPRFGSEHETFYSWNAVLPPSRCPPSSTSSSPLSSSLREASMLPRRNAILRRTGVQYWDAKILSQHVRKIKYADFMADSATAATAAAADDGGGGGGGGFSPAFWDVVIDLCRLGIVYLRDVPRSEDAVERITLRIASIRETFYGRTFDVRAKPDAENVAYTSGYLGLHQDLCYLSPPPKIQVLHCLDNSCRGGESLFSDGERAGRLLWPYVTSSLKLAPLADHKVPYRYDKHGYLYYHARSVIAHEHDNGDGHNTPGHSDGGGGGGYDRRGGFAGVYWSPPFQGRYDQHHAAASSLGMDLKEWIAPARVFEELINSSDAVYSYKMQEGECVLFDNLRVMHGRNAFDTTKDKAGGGGGGGTRWLRGAYIAAEDFYSRAAHIPPRQADMYRGPGEWTPAKAQKELAEGEWHADVLDKVKNLDPTIAA